MIASFSFSAIFIPSRRGKGFLIMLNKYTYSFEVKRSAEERWRCCTHHCKGCRAYIIRKNNTISSIEDSHNHDPPYYMKMPSGAYVRV